MPIKNFGGGTGTVYECHVVQATTTSPDHKFPFTKDGHRKPQIVRYSEARSTIQKYHSHNNDVTVLLDAVEALKKKAAENPDKDPSRIEDNIRAIKTYMKHFQNNQFRVLLARRSHNLSSQQQLQAFPRIVPQPSRTMRGTITSAATGSAHGTCQIALTPRPTRATRER